MSFFGNLFGGKPKKGDTPALPPLIPILPAQVLRLGQAARNQLSGGGVSASSLIMGQNRGNERIVPRIRDITRPRQLFNPNNNNNNGGINFNSNNGGLFGQIRNIVNARRSRIQPIKRGISIK